MNESKLIRSKLLVEGNNDKHVLWALCAKHQLPKNFEIIDLMGKNRLLESIGVYLKEGLEVLGIVLDADENLQQSWDSIRSRFVKEGYSNIPKQPEKGGYIGVFNDKLTSKIGIWIMPDNTATGKLEEFLELLIPFGDALKFEANKVLDNIESKSLQCYAPKDRPKAFMHTWLAWQKNPGMPYGQAITAHVLLTEAELSIAFIRWLQSLFSR